MGDGASAAKICGICGQDCSARPRTKDKSGHYFCKECYEQAKERKQRAGSAMKPAVPPPLTADDEFSLLDRLGDAPLAAQMIPPPVTGHHCSNCGMPLAPESVLCVNCGLNVQTGQQAAIRMAALPRGPKQTAWPIVVGVISLVLGVPGTLLYGASLAINAAAAPWNENPIVAAISLAVVALPLLMCIWLSLGGLGVLRRRQSGVANLRRWAGLSVILGVIFATCVGVLLMGLAGSSGARAQEMAGASAAIFVGLVVMLVIMLAWPIFILIWTSRAAVKAEVERWD